MDEAAMLLLEHEFFALVRSRLARSRWKADRSGNVVSLALEGSPPETRLVIETSTGGRYRYPLWRWPNDEIVESITTYGPETYSSLVLMWLEEGSSIGGESPD
jgi:hypothetical protein